MDILKARISEIKDVFINGCRYTTKPYLEYWMQKYNFSLVDFIFNNKYVVVSDDDINASLDKLSDLGLLNWEHFSKFSEYEWEGNKNEAN